MAKPYKICLLLTLFLSSVESFSATYYNRTGTRYCDTRTDWTTSATGGVGTSPGNFTTAGDIFIVRAGSVMGQFWDWTVGAGVTVNVYGELQNDFFCNMTFNGTLNVQNGGTLRIMWNAGTLNLGTAATFGATSNMIFEDAASLFTPRYNYGNLIFNDAGSDPAMGTTYRLRVQNDLTITDIASTFNISTTASLNHTIGGDLIINEPSTGSLIAFDNGSGSPTLTIGGDLIFNAAAGAPFVANGGTAGVATMTINGDLTMNSSNANFVGTANTGNISINILGDINANAMGAVHISSDNFCAGCTIGNTTMDIAGSIIVGASGHLDLAYNQKGGANTIYVSGSATVATGGIFLGPHNKNKTDGNVPTVIFKSPASGTATGNFSMTGGDYDGAGTGTEDCNNGSGQFNVVIQANRIITLQSNIELGNSRSFTVNAGATLITGTSGGTAYSVRRRQNDGATYATSTVFTLAAASGGLYSEIQANATPDALTAASYSGNIQTNTRNYDPTANYRFNATGAQNTGDFMTSAFNGGRVNKLIVNNTAALITTGLTLTNSVIVTSDLTFIAGRLKTTSASLPTIDYSGTASGYTIASTNTAYVDGPMAKNTSSTAEFLFPTGNSTGNRFRPVAYTPSSAAATTYQVQLQNGFAGGSVLTTLNWVCPLFYWDSKYNTATTTPATVKLYYIDIDLLLAPLSLLDYYVTTTQFNYSTGSSLWENTGMSAIDSVSSMHYVRSALVPTMGTSKYLAIAQAIKPLPVELLLFTGRKEASGNVLRWITASELNSDYFTVEKSTDGINFSMLEKVKSAGNSRIQLSYSCTDRNPGKGISYYRLRQTDFNGAVSIFNTVLINNGNGQAVITLLKSADRSDLLLNSPEEGNYRLGMYDITGRAILNYSGYLIPGESGNTVTLPDVHGTFVITFEQKGYSVSQKIVL